MSVNTKIEWCDSTWNPVTGCLHGCEYCYAAKIARRFGLHFDEPDISKRVLLDLVWDGEKIISSYPFDFQPTFHKYRLDVPQKWKKSRNIFVCSMADLFGDWVPDEWIEEVFDACEKAPQHRYLFLTKSEWRYGDLDYCLPQAENMWYGTTATGTDGYYYCNPRVNTFLSIEPIQSDFPADINFGVDWLIIGAETGNQKGKIIPEKSWIDHVCEAADREKIPVFMKDSLIPIAGEENMRREFPWEVQKNV